MMILSVWSAQFSRTIEEQHQQAKEGKTLKQLTKAIDNGKLFDQALTISSDNDIVHSLDALAYTTDYLNKSYTDWCGMTTADVKALLPQGNTIQQKEEQYQSRLARQPANQPTDRELFYTSCKKLLTCTNGREPAMTRPQQLHCIDLTSTIFSLSRTHIGLQDASKQLNYADNIFADGNINNASFDLMNDLKKIGDILYKDNKQPVEVLFYEFPTVDAPAEWIDPNDIPPTWWGVAWPWSRIGDATGTVWSGAESWSGDAEGETGNNDQDDQNPWQFPWNNEIDNFINNTNLPVSSLPTNPALGALAGGNLCLPVPDDTAIEPQRTLDQAQNYQDSIQDGIDDLRDSLDGWDGLDTILEQWWIDPSIISDAWLDSILDNFINFATTYPNDESIQQCRSQCTDIEADRDRMTCEANCCIDTCSGLKDSDKAICVSQCLCGEIKSRDAIDNGGQASYRIRFCRVPVTKTPIAQNKKVQSIEEVLYELNNVLVELKTSGQSIKHNTTREFLDTSMKSINFGEIFSFNLVFTTKPIFQSLPPATRTRKAQERNKKLERELLNNRGDLSLTTERNKYIIIDDPFAQKAGSALGEYYGSADATLASLKSAVELQSANVNQLSILSQQDTMIVWTEQMGQFGQSSYTMIQNIYESIVSMNKDAKAMFAKFKRDG